MANIEKLDLEKLNQANGAVANCEANLELAKQRLSQVVNAFASCYGKEITIDGIDYSICLRGNTHFLKKKKGQ